MPLFILRGGTIYPKDWYSRDVVVDSRQVVYYTGKDTCQVLLLLTIWEIETVRGIPVLFYGRVS